MKKILFLFSLFIFTVIFSACIIFLFIFFTSMEDFNMYKIPKDSVTVIFGTTSEKFFEIDMAYYTYTGDFRDNAKIDSKGNLILKLSDEQENAWIEWYLPTIKTARDAGIFISDDYTELIMYGNYEEVISQISNMPVSILNALVTNQLLKKVDPSAIHIHYKVINTENGKTVYDFDWPSCEEFKINYKREDFLD